MHPVTHPVAHADDKDCLEQARFVLSRYDQLYESVNTKGNLYLALNAIIIGGIATSYSFLDGKLHFATLSNLTLIAMLILCAASIGCTLAAINPFTLARSGKISGTATHSLLFFGEVAKLDEQFYINSFIGRDISSHLKDVLSQCHVLAGGLCAKYGRLKWAGWLLSLSLFLFVLSTLILLLKQL